MKHLKDTLQTPIERLQRTLGDPPGGHEPDWVKKLGRGLSALQRALQRHAAEMEECGGLYQEVDGTRPAFTRQLARLHQEHKDFLDKVCFLREQARRTRDAACGIADLPPRENKGSGGGPPTDCGALRQGIEQFLTTLLDHEKHETDLVLE